MARYDKIHMFDVDLAGGESYRESRSYRPGELAVNADLPWGRLGLTICYDLRFPALYRALAEAGASFLAIPSAFTRQTGEAHWHVLMRARAIENTSSCSPPRKAASTRTAARRSAIRWWSIRGAASSPKAAASRASCSPTSIRPRSSAARAPRPSLQRGRRFEMLEPMAEPAHLHVVGGEA